MKPYIVLVLDAMAQVGVASPGVMRADEAELNGLADTVERCHSVAWVYSALDGTKLGDCGSGGRTGLFETCKNKEKADAKDEIPDSD